MEPSEAVDNIILELHNHAHTKRILTQILSH